MEKMLIIEGAANQHLSQNVIFCCSFCSANQHNDSTWKNVDSDWAFESTFFAVCKFCCSLRHVESTYCLKFKKCWLSQVLQINIFLKMVYFVVLFVKRINIVIQHEKMLIRIELLNQLFSAICKFCCSVGNCQSTY